MQARAGRGAGATDRDQRRPARDLELAERQRVVLARFVGCGPVALDAEDPRAPLPVAAELAAADETSQIEGVG